MDEMAFFNFSLEDYDFNSSDFLSFLPILNNTFDIPENDRLPEELPDKLKTIITVLYSIIIAGAFLGNSVVICVILANSAMRNVTNVFLISLAISDILIAVWNMPLMLMYHLSSEWTHGEPLCKTISFMTSVTVFASIVTLTAVSTERYYAVCHPLKARYIRTNKRAAIALVIIWTVAIAVSLPFTWLQRVELRLALTPDADVGIRIAELCAEKYPNATLDHLHTYIIFVFWYIVPMAIMFFTYGSIAHRLWMRKPIGDAQESPQNIDKLKRKIIKMLIIIVLVFGICWLPFFAIQIYRLHNSATYGYRIALTIIQLIGYSNSMMNPLIYGFMNQRFQQSLKAMFRKCKHVSAFGKNNGTLHNGHTINSITVESAV
ncbi:hypothetical protein FSP39_001631 [Pinctada imbricata]|uniref:G-protein coupled receptors family 1 profile domain-containing protein n=1 Tax=Pinctada imbricata TaxID=66713 RepID=A0AA88Y4B4_PINIB|nr:hypothetical protein FSP39_001631 [Pinctada imbricata]